MVDRVQHDDTDIRVVRSGVAIVGLERGAVMATRKAILAQRQADEEALEREIRKCDAGGVEWANYYTGPEWYKLDVVEIAEHFFLAACAYLRPQLAAVEQERDRLKRAVWKTLPDAEGEGGEKWEEQRALATARSADYEETAGESERLREQVTVLEARMREAEARAVPADVLIRVRASLELYRALIAHPEEIADITYQLAALPNPGAPKEG